MPIFEYVCPNCGSKFEKLILSARRERELKCPQCGSGDAKKVLSVFGVGASSGGSAGAGASNCAPSG